MQTSQNSHFHHSVGWAEFYKLPELGKYLSELSDYFGLGTLPKGLSNAEILQHLSAQLGGADEIPDFEPQGKFEHESRYYEQIIYQDKTVPTREDSWHDFFNGLIWLLFPKTKHLLNQLHTRDITEFGLNPRTPLRNRITHFDECGLILIAMSERALEISAMLAEHRWHDALYVNNSLWHRELYPVVFGHANLEMLLNPYLQLTAKWCVLDFTDVDYVHWTKGGFRNMDERLSKALSNDSWLFDKGRLHPLPLLGIPNWYENQDTAFYAQENVFRPKRKKRL